MLKVELSKKTENPFYGMRNTLALFQNAGKGVVNTSLLDAAIAECKSKEQKELFFTLLFSIRLLFFTVFTLFFRIVSNDTYSLNKPANKNFLY